MRFLQSDLSSFNLTEWKFRYQITHETLSFQRLLRKVEYYTNCRAGLLSRIYLLFIKYRFKKKSIQLGLSIPYNVFDEGLSIAHYGSVVVSGKAKVGKNCRIHSATNIGVYNGKAPDIGDNVYIAPGVKIYGDIKIGDNVTIGANAVVNKDVPDNVVVAGVPAKIISRKNVK